MSSLQLWVFVCSTVGPFAVPSLVRLSHGGRLGATISDGRLLSVVGVELVLGLIWTLRLRSQGWTLASLTEPFAPRDLARGCGLLMAAVFAYWCTWYVAVMVAPGFASAARDVVIQGHPSPSVILLLSVVNPIFEELLYLGVLGASLRREGPQLALSASVLARAVVHLYQGPLGILGILPGGIVFGLYYLRTRRLWPVVAAHGLMDVWALAALR